MTKRKTTKVKTQARRTKMLSMRKQTLRDLSPESIEPQRWQEAHERAFVWSMQARPDRRMRSLDLHDGCRR